MTPAKAQRRAEDIVRAAASDATQGWIAAARAAGVTIEEVHSEIVAAEAEAQTIVARAVETIAPLIHRIEDENGIDPTDVESLLLNAARSTGRCRLNPAKGWWGPC